MRCEHCDQADRQPVRRAKLAERDHKVAVVLEVPMEECPACGERWLRWDVAGRLDEPGWCVSFLRRAMRRNLTHQPAGRDSVEISSAKRHSDRHAEMNVSGARSGKRVERAHDGW